VDYKFKHCKIPNKHKQQQQNSHNSSRFRVIKVFVQQNQLQLELRMQKRIVEVIHQKKETLKQPNHLKVQLFGEGDKLT